MWKCPKCKSEELLVTVEVWRRLEQNSDEDGDFETTEEGVDDLSEEWTSNSVMRCLDCGHYGIAGDFDTTVGSSPDEDEETAFPWCSACKSYHHPNNPTCRKLPNPLRESGSIEQDATDKVSKIAQFAIEAYEKGCSMDFPTSKSDAVLATVEEFAGESK